MIEYETKVKKWGNSAGVVVPKDAIKKEHLKVNQKVRVIITPKNAMKVEDIFGGLKNWKKSTEEIMREIDKDLESKYLK